MIQGWRGKDGDRKPVPFECEERQWLYYTSTGEQMFVDTHFRTEAEAWASILKSVTAGVNLCGAAVIRARGKLMEMERQAAEAVAQFAEATENYRQWLQEKEQQNG